MSKEHVCYCPASNELTVISEAGLAKSSDANGEFYMYFIWGTQTFVKLYIIGEL